MENSKDIFTGERFVPGIEDIKLEMEHYQRYLSVAKLVKDKVVLDAASGEGYGSNILAQSAKKVIGLDIDEGAINRSKETYKSQSNLSYVQGSIAELPIEDNSLDVVVSFETIEHVPEELQQMYLKEIKRVLKPDGFMIMSTPNKEIYSDKYDYHNEFHIKEFYKQEFIDFLHQEFKHVKLYNQFFEVTAVIDSCEENDSIAQYFKNQDKYTQEGKYYIGIASNNMLPEESIASVFMNEKQEYEETIDRIFDLQAQVDERNAHLHKLDEQIQKNGETIVQLQQGEFERNAHIQKLDIEIEKANIEIEKANIEIEKANIEMSSLRLECNKKDFALQQNEKVLYEKVMAIEALNNKLLTVKAEYQGKIDDLDITVQEMTREQQRLNDEVEQRGNHIMKLDGEIEALRQIVRNKEGHIELLLEVEREYEREKQTHSYKFGKKIQKIGDFLLPPNSKRRFFARIIVNVFRKPKIMIKMFTPKRIKSYFYYLKREGMSGVLTRYQEAYDLEKEYVEPTPAVEVKAEKVIARKSIEEYEPIAFTVEEKPTVSIVIPVYNEFDYTYNCLKSIKEKSGDVTYEIVIANDCSTDLTTEMDKIISGVQVITTEKNLRFLLNCNNAAKYAKGEYILFLNNDTQVQENWLQPLVDLMEQDETIGMTGSKLVYADGRLQEAGGIFWKDASAWNYGNRCNPEEPEYNYVKDADYISGAAIMIRHNLWKEIGGFDETFVPAYYEDSDLAFEVRKHGYRVVYQPLSVVVHFEGVSNGTDTSTGQKHYQVVNQEKFYNKWKDVLEKEHFPNAENVFLAKDRSRFKKQILVVDHYVPHYDKDAGGRCTYMYLKLFVKLGMKVTFIGDNFFKHEPYTTELTQMGVEVLYGNYYYNNWKSWLKENAHYFDYIYLQRPHIAVKYMDLVKKYSNAKIFYFAHDLHYVREMREYELTGDKAHLKASEHWKTIEHDLFSKADVEHLVGSYEQGVVQEAFPDKAVRNIPLYIYEQLRDDINKKFEERKDIMYVGGFGHPPNIDAVLWFGREVFPKILEKYPDIKWYVVGSKVTEEIQAMASDNIIVTGFLSDEDLEALYKKCRMAVVPLRVGAGVKGKVVEAAYYQIPLVTTSIGAEGLSTEEHAFEVVDDAEEMAELINELYTDYDKLLELSDNSRTFIERYFMLSEAERVIRMDMDI